MRTGPLLASDLVDRYQPLGAFGQPVYLSWVQLRATIAQTLGQRHANYFARPDRDPNNRTLHWIAEVPGTARRWADLSAEEQASVALDLHALRSDFLRYVTELRGQGGGASAEGKGAAAFASLLEQAMLVPDDSHLHFVGDQPVVSFWGFRGVDGQGVDPLATAPRRAPAAAAVASAGEAAPAAGVGVPLQPAPRPWWRRWLWALLALLLLLLLLFLLAWCTGDREQPLSSALPPGSTPPATDGTPPEPGGFVDRTLRYLGLEDSAPGDGTTLGRSLPGDTVIPGSEVKTLPDGTVPIPPDGANLDGSKPGDTGSSEPPQPPATPAEPPPPPTDAQGKPDQPKAPDTPADQPNPGQPPGQPPSSPPSPPKPDAGAKGQPLQIPPDTAGKPGDLGFVGGEWRSDSGLVDQATKQPLQQVYRFDDKGKGEVVIRRADGVECRAPAQATMQGGKLGIEESGQPTCPDGRTYSPSKTECTRTPSGQTVCQGRNADGSTYRVGIERAAPTP